MASTSRQRRQVALPLVAIAALVGCVLFGMQSSLRSGRTELYAVENLDGSLAALSSNEVGGLGGSVAGVKSSSENLQGSLAGFPADSDMLGSVMAADKSDVMNVNGALARVSHSDQANLAGALGAAPAEDIINTQGVLAAPSSAKKGVDYHNGNSAISELDSYFDNLPTHDVTADHAAPHQQLTQPSGAVPAVHLAAGGFKQARNGQEEWNNKLANMKEAVRLFKTKGDKALEDAVSMGLTQHPVEKGASLQQSRADISDAESIIAQAGKQGGVDGYRAKEYTKQVTNLKTGMAAEEQTMQRLNAELAARTRELDAEQQEKSAATAQTKEAAEEKKSVEKQNDGALNFNPESTRWKYDEFSDFNPPASGAPKMTSGARKEDVASANIVAFAHGMAKSLSSLKDAISEKQAELHEARAELIHAKGTINAALAAMDGGSATAEEEEEEQAVEEKSSGVQQLAGLDKKQQQWLGSRPDFEHKNSPTDGWLDYNPHSSAWGYDHHLNKNPTGGAPVYTKVDHDPNGGADRIGALQAPFQPKKVDIEVPDSFQVDEYLDSVSGTHFKKATPQVLKAVNVPGVRGKMRVDEKELDVAQRELRDAQSVLTVLQHKELRHHLKNNMDESMGAELAWDKQDMKVMAHDRREVDALSLAVDRRQRRLSHDVKAMLALKKQQARAKVAKEAQHAPAATLTGAAAREDKAPAFQWLKKHVLAGLREKRAIPAHLKGHGFTRLGAGVSSGQQLAAQNAGRAEADREVKHSVVEAVGVGMCSVLGIACS